MRKVKVWKWEDDNGNLHDTEELAIEANIQIEKEKQEDIETFSSFNKTLKEVRAILLQGKQEDWEDWEEGRLAIIAAGLSLDDLLKKHGVVLGAACSYLNSSK